MKDDALTPLQSMPEPIETFDVASADIATPTRFEWNGVELHLLSTSGPLVRASVAFATKAQGEWEMRPGEVLRVPRGFGWVWLKSVGAAGQMKFAVVRFPLVQPMQHHSVITPRGTSLDVSSPANTPLNIGGPAGTWVSAVVATPAAGAIIVDTGQLAAGDYEVIMQAIGSPSASSVKVTLQQRDSANAANIHRVVKTWDPKDQTELRLPRIPVAQNERFRIENDTLGTGITASGSIYYRRVA